MCLTIENNFFVCCNATGFHYANTNLGFREPTCFFFPFCCFAYQFVSFCICLSNCVLKNIANASKGEVSWVTGKFVFVHVTPENAGFWIFWICSSHPDSNSVYEHLGMALPLLCLTLCGSDWTIIFSSSACCCFSWLANLVHTCHCQKVH
jgi:hypothetical protein